MIEFGLPDTATPSEVKARWRELASLHHPDHGGDPDVFARLARRYKELLKHAEALAARCSECHGAGHILITTGLSTLKMRCKACNGGGKNGAPIES